MRCSVGLLCLVSAASAFVTPSFPLSGRSATASGALTLKAEALTAPRNTKVVVLGGAGFVGSRVSQALVDAGCIVTSVSKSGTPPAWAEGQPWVSQVQWLAADAATDDLKGTLRGASACVSCVGTIGLDADAMQAGNGAPTVAGAQAAKAAGVNRFVYVSVADSVRDAVQGLPTPMKGYFAGKKEAEEAIAATYGPESSLVVGPGFIYGGDQFALSPPRVTQTYGSFIDSTLSLAPFKALAGVLPGLVGVALQAPVSVTDVAKAVACGALGLQSGRVDGTDSIKELAAKAV